MPPSSRRVGERVAAVGGAEQGAAEVQDAGDAVGGQLDRVDRPREQAVGRLADAEDLPAVAVHRALDHGADHGVQAGAVAAAGQQTDAHRDLLARGRRGASVADSGFVDRRSVSISTGAEHNQGRVWSRLRQVDDDRVVERPEIERKLAELRAAHRALDERINELIRRLSATSSSCSA